MSANSITAVSIKTGNEFLFAQQVVDFLSKAFPGWKWAAMVEGGVLYIKNLDLSAKWGMQKAVNSVDKRWVLNAGGEFLDRFNMPVVFNQTALKECDRDFSGNPLSEKWTPDKRYYSKTEKRWKI